MRHQATGSTCRSLATRHTARMGPQRDQRHDQNNHLLIQRTQTVRRQQPGDPIPGRPGIHGSSLKPRTSRADNTIEEVPSVDEWNNQRPPCDAQYPVGRYRQFRSRQQSLNNQYQASATNLFTGGGSHELKYGVLVQGVDYNQVNDRTGPTFITPAGDETATGAEHPDPLGSDIRFNLACHARQPQRCARNVAAQLEFLRAGHLACRQRVTLNPGVRYDQQHLVGVLGASSISRTTGVPRIGVDVRPEAGTGRTKVYGHYGRYYSQIPNDLAARALSADAGIGADYFDANLTQPVPEGVLALGTTRSTTRSPAPGLTAIDPNAR